MSVTEKGFEERAATVFEEKRCQTAAMLIINFTINWIYLESSCFYFPQMPRKMTKFGLNDMFENMKLFLKRASSSDQIKSSMFVSLQFYIQVVEVLHYFSQKSISFPLSFPIKAENAWASLQIWLTSRKKTEGQKSLQNCSVTHASFIICAQVNLYNCIVFGKKRFHRCFLALNPLFPPGETL